MASKASEVRDLTAADQGAEQSRALQNLKKNLSHFLISEMADEGPEIQFGDTVLYFKAKIPATATVELLSNDNKVEGLQNYIRLSLVPTSREDFDALLDNIPLEALNAIVEAVSEAAVPFPTK